MCNLLGVSARDALLPNPTIQGRMRGERGVVILFGRADADVYRGVHDAPANADVVMGRAEDKDALMVGDALNMQVGIADRAHVFLDYRVGFHLRKGEVVIYGERH